MAANDLGPILSPDGEDTRGSLLRQILLVFTLALTLNLAGNGRVGLWDRDEPRYATCVREMIERSDWVFPTYNAEPRYHKPVLIYWLMRGAYNVFGDNTFGARLVSSICGALSCVLIWWLGRRIVGRTAGLVGALVLASAPIMVVESKLATTDAALTLFLIGCQACLWELARRPSRGLAAGFWVLMALATLTKGPVAPGFILVSGLLSWWFGGPTACFRRLEWKWGVPLFLALIAPWYIAIGILSNGDFYRVAMGYHVIRRMTSGLEEHGGFPGYYVATTLVTFHPWSSLLAPACYSAWVRRKSNPAFGFLLGWVIGPLLLLEAVRTKLVHYYLPAIPACAMLAAWLLAEVARDGANLRRWPLGRLALGLLGGVGLTASVGLLAGAYMVPSLRWPLLTIGLGMALGTLFALDRFQRGFTDLAVRGLVATWSLVLLGAGTWLLPAAEPYRMSRVVGEKLADLSGRYRATPAMFSYQEPGVVFALRRPAQPIRDRASLVELVRRDRLVISAMLDAEVRVLKADPQFRVEVAESIHGFNLSKGKMQTLNFTLIAPADPALAARPQPLPVK